MALAGEGAGTGLCGLRGLCNTAESLPAFLQAVPLFTQHCQALRGTGQGLGGHGALSSRASVLLSSL